jgi:hypothetical protein
MAPIGYSMPLEKLICVKDQKLKISYQTPLSKKSKYLNQGCEFPTYLRFYKTNFVV